MSEDERSDLQQIGKFAFGVYPSVSTWDSLGVGVEPHSPGARSRHQYPGHGLRHLQQARGGQEEEEQGQPSHWHWPQHRAFL